MPTTIELETILSNGFYRENNPTEYAFTALAWLSQYATQHSSDGWVTEIDPHFFAAVSACLTFREAQAKHEVLTKILDELSALPNWRTNIDHQTHPMARLGRIVNGDPGPELEYAGPHFLLTISEIIEGLTNGLVIGEWRLERDPQRARILMALVVSCLGALAMTVFWATRGYGGHLHEELRRVFRRTTNPDGLRGQLANLFLAGHALSWGNRVDFVSEGGGQETPDWKLSRVFPSHEELHLWVECTSVKRPLDAEMNDRNALRRAVAKAWAEKNTKFHDEFRPGIIGLDMSAIFINLEFGTHFALPLITHRQLAVPDGGARTCGIYNARSDWELMARESLNRDLLALFASALHSQAAIDNDIKGLLIYFGQAVLVNTVTGHIQRREGGALGWSGSESDSAIDLALSLCNAPIANSPPQEGRDPQFSLYLV